MRPGGLPENAFLAILLVGIVGTVIWEIGRWLVY